MCPACIETVALFAAGAASTGGLTALAAKKLHAKTGTNKIDPTTKIKGGEDEPSERTTSDPRTEIRGE